MKLHLLRCVILEVKLLKQSEQIRIVTNISAIICNATKHMLF